MDLVYTDAGFSDVAVLHDYTFDLAYGADENDFLLTLPLLHPVRLKPHTLIYVDGTEYGGIIDWVEADTTSETTPVIRYLGRTWHGVIESKVIRPAVGADYYIISGDANACLGMLIAHMGLTSLLTTPVGPSGIVIARYQFERYVTGYKGIKAMLASVGAKLIIQWTGSKAEISAEHIVDYTGEEFSSDHDSFKLTKLYRPINHLVCLGGGELRDRTVIDLYSDAQGNISQHQTFTGLDERCEVYNYGNVEDDEELLSEGIKKLREYQDQDTCEISIPPGHIYDIGDMAAARQEDVGISITAHISKKIVQITEAKETISYEVGAVTASASFI